MSNIVSETISLMIKANIELPNAKGRDKKKWVLDQLKELITLDNEVEDLIIYLIDILIDVENGKLIINPKVKNGCLGCFTFLKKNC